MPNNISIPGAVAIAILVVLVLIVIVRNIYVVQQSKAYVVERLGAFHSVWGVGLHLKVPFIERVVKKVSLKEQVADFDPQPVITKDNVTMQIDTVIYFQITDPKLYTYGVEYPMNAIENLTATTLRNIIGELELDQSLTSRDTINAKMRAILDEATDPWGIKVNRVELKNILPPREIQNAMEKQMKAERERRESILQAEGEKASKILVAEGEKQSAILKADAAKQARIMAAEAEATSIMKVQQALADAMRMLNENAPNDQVIKLKSLEALQKMADGKATKIIIPSEIQGLAGLAASIRENGVLQPITVRKNPGREYELVSGERRLRAAKEAGLRQIPAVVIDTTARQSAIYAILENIQRQDLSVFEEARALRCLITEWGVTQEEAAQKLGKAQSTIANKLRLLALTDAEQQLIVKSGLTERHARALLKVPTPEKRMETLKYAIRSHLNVSQLEAYIARSEKAPPPPPKRRVLVVKDVRVFLNTINKAIDTMKSAGIPAEATRREENGCIEYLVKIPIRA